MENPSPTIRTSIPQEYQDLKGVFSKEGAGQLSTHHPWGCTTELLPNAMLPKCKIYPLSLPETRPMEEYIEEALAAGYIQ